MTVSVNDAARSIGLLSDRKGKEAERDARITLIISFLIKITSDTDIWLLLQT